MERRGFERVIFVHRAEMVFANRSWDCLIRDFCPGGVLIEFDPARTPPLKGEIAFMSGDNVTINMTCQWRGKEVLIEFTGEARHRVTDAVGIRFLDISDKALTVLKTKSGYLRLETESQRQREKRQPEAAPQDPELQARAKKLLELYQRLVLERLPLALERSIKDVNARLMDSASESRDSWLRADFALSQQMLERRSHWISEQVCRAAMHCLRGASKASPGADKEQTLENRSVETLSVVEKNDFEDWLAMQMAIRLIENSLGLDLDRLCQVLDQLQPGKHDPGSLAVGPALILKALQRCLSHEQLPAIAYPVVFKMAGKRLNTELRDLYAVMLSLAERHGFHSEEKAQASVLAYQPSIRVKSAASRTAASRPTQKPVRRPQGQGTAGADAGGAISTGKIPPPASRNNAPARQTSLTSDYPGSDEHTYKTLQSLIRLKAAVAGGKPLVDTTETVGEKDQDAAQAFGREDLVAAIERLQVSGVASRATSIKDSLIQQLCGDGRQGRLLEKDNELLEITDKLFETILNQLNVNDVVKKWLQKLKLPILKVVLLDDTFFSNQNHVARQVINHLARLGAVRRSTNTSLDASLDEFANRIAAEYRGDPHLFEEILHELRILIDRQEKAFERNAERIARAHEGQQKLARAKERVRQELNDRFAGLSVPKALLALLAEGGWRQFMIVSLLREGDKSQVWKESLAAIDQLLIWLSTGYGEDCLLGENIERELEGPTLLASIDRELMAFGQTGHKPILDKLRTCLLQGKKPATEFVEAYDWTDKVEGESRHLTRPNDASVRGATRWHRRARQMTIGDWVEIDGEGQKQRLRLAWTGTESFRFVYVDSHGLKDIDISLDDIARQMESGELTVLEQQEVPLVDQGLHQMVQSVYEDLASQASCDPLTGLLNRQAFERSLDRAVAEALAHHRSFVLCYIDIDQFKVLNNTYGHVAGDALLKQIARVIRQSSPAQVICGRLGGNEFGMIFYQATVDEATLNANQLRNQVQAQPFAWQENDIQVTVSIGLAQVDTATDTHDSVMRKANAACALAKQYGRNRVLVYTEQDRDQARHEEMVAWVRRMDRSLEDFLLIRAQEIRAIDASANKLPHYEILIGVRDESGNILSPVAFIEAAEHFGRMPKVDRYVVHSVLRWLDENPEMVAKIDGLSINLSGTSMNDESFLSFVLGELASCSAPKDKICFEITETAAVTSLADASDFMRQIKRIGCKFSLDDFGTGLSSYAYIQKLPIDYIKIDGVFVKNILNNHKDQALVRSISELAHFMGLETIAEFVENGDILAMLASLGVDYVQGYGIHKPVPLVVLAENLA